MYHQNRIHESSFYSPLSSEHAQELSTKPIMTSAGDDPDVLRHLSGEQFAIVFNGLRQFSGSMEQHMTAAVRHYTDHAWNIRGERVMTQTEYLEWRSGHTAGEILAHFAVEEATVEPIGVADLSNTSYLELTPQDRQFLAAA